MSTFAQLLNKFRQDAFSERDKGYRFERLMQAYLKTTTLYANLFEEVWLWTEFPFHDQFGGKDTGIDLVARTVEGEYWAIQCKCYAANAFINKPDVDTFLSTSGKRFETESGMTGFVQRLWISTTNKWNSTAEQTIRNQNPPVTRLNLIDLENDDVDWNSLEQGIFGIYPDEKNRWYVKVPAFSFSKLHGMDTYLSPEMKSTGEAIGYDNKLNRALYKALQASGMNILNYGTVFATIADKDKEEALPLIRRFYELGFNIEATKGTADFLKEHGIRTRVRAKISDGSDEIIESIRHGYVSYVINTRDINDMQNSDGWEIRQCAVENNVTMFTALDTVRVLLDVLEETTLCISTIDA